MRTNQLRIIDEFTNLVAIDSPSYDERQAGDYIKKKLTALGLVVVEDDAGEKIGGNCGNIYGYLEGDLDLEPLLFCAHLDTVEPARGKEAVIDADGVIHSRGNTVLGADDMAGVTAILEALTVLTEHKLSHRPIEVLFTVAEEVYCRGSAEFDFTKVLSREAYVLDLAGRVGTAAYMAPSILSFTATVRGRASHAGFAPQKGIHAIAVAADAISMLPMGRVDDETTLNVGMIKGGLATNIVPDHCVVRGEVRSLCHEKASRHAELVKKQFERSASAAHAALEFDLKTVSVAYETPLASPVVKRFENACNTLGLPVSLVKTFGGSDNNMMAQSGLIGLVIANAMNRCHACDEFTTTEELERAAELTLALMTDDR
ncbi:M20/M25/M40 family metallo-hydrolase [Oscillospiraceae bacterium CM]|nr:M20/M25/M40 family metallo-hydrolase [Oscillospiraceae bacterium CM]